MENSVATEIHRACYRLWLIGKYLEQIPDDVPRVRGLKAHFASLDKTLQGLREVALKETENDPKIL